MDAYKQFARMLGEIKRPTPELLEVWLRHRPIRGASQVFAMDAQTLTAAIPLVTTTQTFITVTRALRSPFQNCKIAVWGVALVTTGTGVTAVTVVISRNNTAENLFVFNPANFVVGASTTTYIPFAITDQVPDGRDCTYSLFLTQVGATGNGSALAQTTIMAQVISG